MGILPKTDSCRKLRPIKSLINLQFATAKKNLQKNLFYGVFWNTFFDNFPKTGILKRGCFEIWKEEEPPQSASLREETENQKNTNWDQSLKLKSQKKTYLWYSPWLSMWYNSWLS